MGKSAKLFKSLVGGVKVFKSPSKEKSKEPSSTPHSTSKREDKRHGGKDKCMWSLGKSSSRGRDAYAVAAAASPEAIEIKCVEVDSEKLKDVLPVPTAEPCVEGKGPLKARHDTTIGTLQWTCPAESPIGFEQEQLAAAKIQAAFRCYLAQRAFRALRALVRLQALARGRIVRKQALSSLRCIQALIRIQALARGSRVRSSELGQVVRKHLQQAGPPKKKPVEGWVNGTTNSHTRAQGKQDVAMKRQRALVAVLLEQLIKDSPKQRSFTECDNVLKKSHWAWIWLERWTVASTTSASSRATTSAEERNAVADKSTEKEKATVRVGNKNKEILKKEVKKGSNELSNSPAKGQAQTPSAVKREEKVKTPTRETEKVAKREEKVVTREEKVKTPIMEMQKVRREEKVKTPTETEKVDPKNRNMLGSSGSDPAMLTKSTSPMPPSASPSLSLKNDVRMSEETSLQAEESSHTRSPAVEILPIPNAWEMEGVYPNAVDSQPRSLTNSTMDPCDDVAKPDPLPNGSMSPSLPSEPLQPSYPPSASLQERIGGDDLPHVISVLEMVGMSESTLSLEGGEATRPVSEEAVDATDELEVGLKDELEEAICVDMMSPEANGGCDTSIASCEEKSDKSSTKFAAPGGAKHDAHVESGGSPAVLPSYMATTQSAKAKIRTLTSPCCKQMSADSPKQKAGSLKNKLDSPKLTTESPKLKLDPLIPKPDSASKRRHSLSAFDGSKPSSAIPITKQTMHVRVNSKGHLKDTSIDGSPISNGGGSGRQRN